MAKSKKSKKGKSTSKANPKSTISKASSADSSAASKKSKIASKSKHKTKSESAYTTSSSSSSSTAKSSKASSAYSGTRTSTLSASLVGASHKAQSSAISGKSRAEASTAPGRPMLTNKAKKIMKTSGATKVKSMKALEKKHYKLGAGLGKNLFKATAAGKKKAMVKVININKISPRYRVNLDKFSIKIMKFISCKKVCSTFCHIYNVFLIDKSYYIFFEICDNTSLYNVVSSSQEIPAERIRKWMKQMTEGVIVLQRYGIAHRFLKLKHLLISQKDNLKISGWTKSVMFWDPVKKKILLQRKECRARKNNYLPPEAFRSNYDPSKGDVWAIGVTLVNLCTHRYPFHVRNKTKFIKQWRLFVKKHSMNPIIRSICNNIFVIDLNKRIRARDLIKEEFFKSDTAHLVNKSTREEPLKQTKKAKKPKKTANKKSKKNAEETEELEKVSQAELAAEEEDKKADEQQKEEEKAEQEEEADGDATGEEGGQVGEKEEGEVEEQEEAQEMNAPEETADKAEPVEVEAGAEIKDVVDGTAAQEVKDALAKEEDKGEEAAGEEEGGEDAGGEDGAAEGGEAAAEAGGEEGTTATPAQQPAQAPAAAAAAAPPAAPADAPGAAPTPEAGGGPPA